MPTVAELMTTDLAVVSPHDSLQRAAQLMDEYNVGALPVCDGPRLLGLITDRDITVRATSAGLPPAATPVGEVMSEQLRTCRPGEAPEAVMRQMAEVRIRRVPVVDDEGHLVGIVSLGDLATRHGGRIEDTLRAISWPSAPERPQPPDRPLR